MLRSISTRDRTVPAVDRAARLLDVLCRTGRDWGLSEIAREVGIHKGTARGILLTLRQHGLVDRVGATGRFRLGSGAARLAQAAISRLDVRDAARASMLHLRDETGETVLLGVREEQHVTIAEMIAPSRELHVSARVGQRLPLCAGSFGKVFLAEPGAFEEYLEAGGTLRGFTPSTQTDADVYAAELLVARAKGYALDDEEYLNGVRAASAIIRGPVGVAIGAVTVVGFTARVSLRSLEEIGQACREAAEEISRRVGGRSSADQS